jgi:hypothetical protein
LNVTRNKLAKFGDWPFGPDAITDCKSPMNPLPFP